MSWFSALPVQVQAALIGALVTLLGIVSRDLIFRLLQERRERKRSTFEVYRRYADPLTSAATSLLWRLHEVFYHPGRGDYLKEARTEFENYKKVSTLYRLGCILGWIRAFKRELSFLQAQNTKQIESVETAISEFESALADGPHIEARRLKGLADLWNLELPDDENARFVIGVALNNLIKPVLVKRQVCVACELPDDEQQELCRQAAELVCSKLGANRIPEGILNEMSARAIRQISIRESWLYRDWQAGIGDLMIAKTSSGQRNFEVVGYKDFESMVLAGKKEEERWLARLKGTLDDLDVSGADEFDARVNQLRTTMIANAKLIRALAQVKTRQHLVSDKTLRIADEILRDPVSRQVDETPKH